MAKPLTAIATSKQHLSKRALSMMPSPIRAVANAGIERTDLIQLWFGESAWPTPAPIVEAARTALLDGDHFYAPNAGKTDLREAISKYYRRIYNLDVPLSRILVTGSGMLALALSAQSLITPGDRAILLEPVWPNLRETLKLAGANISTARLEANLEGCWRLDADRLLEAITPNTRVVVINSPNNPSGWTIPQDVLDAVVAHCRRFGVWLLADDVYSRLYYGAGYAPSLLAASTPEDRVLSVNSFSKAWCMTGWRLGWLVVPEGFCDTYEQMTEYFSSCVPGFSQAGGVTALDEGEPEVAALMEKLRDARELVATRLAEMPRVKFAKPDGAFYAFFSVDGLSDSTAAAKDLVRNAGVGLAPGCAFGPSGEGFLRICFAKEPAVLHDALDRIGNYLARA